MSGRWGGRSSGLAGSRDFRRIARDDFNGKQGVGRPPHSMTEHASGMSPEYVRGYDAVKGYDGSRFELRYVAVDDQPWHVVDSNAGDDPEKGPADKVKKFSSQEEAERYILDENRKELEEQTDDRKELHYRKHPKE